MNLSKVIACLIVLNFTAACHTRPAVVEEPSSSTPPPAGAQQPAAETQAPNYAWNYDGDKGVDAWGSLSPENVACAKGKKQSPINLAWRKPSKKMPRMDFSYVATNASADLSTPIPSLKMNGPNQLLMNGKVYNLERIEFHSPSEHQLSKNSMSMEIQFVHKAVSGNGYAVLSVFAIEGRENSLLNEVWNQFITPSASGMTFDASLLVPPQKTHYHYMGSLTSPPCTEGVEWAVFNTPTELSKEQIIAFRSKFAANSRPPQPLNGRKVTNY